MLLDALAVLLKLKDLFEKVNFETSLAADNNKSINNYSTCKELILALIVIPINLGTIAIEFM